MVEAAAPTFTLSRFTELSQACAVDADAIPTDSFADLLDNNVLMLQAMGSMMSVAFSGKSAIFDIMMSSINTLFKIF